jgi:hypothetical protein
VERYVKGLTEPLIDPRYDGVLVQNPIFAPASAGEPPRGRNEIVLVGIVGVPWQDLATADSLADPNLLQYLTSDELEANGRWPVILGDPEAPVPPADPFMVESASPRPAGAVNPLVPSAVILSPDSTSLGPINGHEHVGGDELEYACTFPIDPIPCDDDNARTCECNADEEARARPLCAYPGGSGTDRVGPPQ